MFFKRNSSAVWRNKEGKLACQEDSYRQIDTSHNNSEEN